MRPLPTAVARLLVVLALAGIAFLYYFRLAASPMYIAHDEAMFGVAAHELAWHARDVDGRFLPLMMPMSGVYWNMPAHVYLTAAVVRAFGTTETAIRAAGATASLLAIVLMYVFCRRVFRHRGFAVLGATLFALTPSFFIDSRQSTDHHYPAVAIALWLICLARFFEGSGSDLWLGFAGLSLGAGIYTYGASVLLMPIYAALTVLLLLRMKVYRVRAYAVFGVVFAIAALPFVFFLIKHPGYIGDVARMYKVYDAKRFNPLQGAHELMNWTSLGARADVYFSYFNPSVLFFSGAPTRQSGFFLPPYLILLPAGILYILKRHVEWFAWIAVAAFFATPLAAAVVDEHGALQRVMSLAPFGAVIVSYLALRMSWDSRAWLRAGTWVVVALLAVSFARFYADYLGDYRRRSSVEFEQNIRGALEMAIAEARAGGASDVCISRGVSPYVDWFWKFYLRKHAAHTIYFDNPGDAGNKCAPGTILVAEIGACDQIAATRTTAPKKILEPGGSPSFCVW